MFALDFERLAHCTINIYVEYQNSIKFILTYLKVDVYITISILYLITDAL